MSEHPWTPEHPGAWVDPDEPPPSPAELAADAPFTDCSECGGTGEIRGSGRGEDAPDIEICPRCRGLG